ncbi:MAG: serine protease [Candidatus Falkowbacteria bacterium]
MHHKSKGGRLAVCFMVVAILAITAISARAEAMSDGSTSTVSQVLPNTQVNLISAIVNTSTAAVEQNAYKAAVKIKTYKQNGDYNLSLLGTGSGFFINNSGLVLTNYHVISNDDSSRYSQTTVDTSDMPLAFLICTTKSTAEEPECGYTAKLVAKDKDLDLALLQAVPITKITQSLNSSFLELNQTDSTQINDTIVAIGYPGVGSETITITRGIISGKTNKYSKDWLKTDAVISFGNSGGAAIDQNGKVVGITSMAYSDMLGTIGYIINVTSINSWVSAHLYDAPQENVLMQRMADMAWKSKILKSSNKYINLAPPYEITKPQDWKFEYNQEDQLYINKEKDEDGGSVTVSYSREPFLTNLKDTTVYAKMQKLDSLNDVNSIKETAVNFGGKTKGKKVTVNSTSYSSNSSDIYYLFTAGNSWIQIDYNYGKNNKDKTIVESIIKSFRLREGGAAFVPLKKYVNQWKGVPKYTLTGNANWLLQDQNSKSTSLLAINSANKLYVAAFSMQKFDPETEDKSAKAIIADFNKTTIDLKQMLKVVPTIDFFSEVKPSINLSKTATGFTRMMMAMSKKDSTIKGYLVNYTYYKKVSKDFVMQIELNAFEPDKKKIPQIATDFEKLLKNLTF